MNIFKRQLARIASNIRDHLIFYAASRSQQVQRKLGDLVGVLDRIQAIRRKLSICQARGWPAAAGRITSGIEMAIGDASYPIQELERTAQAGKPHVMSLKEIYQELVRADEEFDALRYHHHWEAAGGHEELFRSRVFGLYLTLDLQLICN